MSDLSGLILDATTSLEVDLTGAVAANQLPFVVCYLVLNKSTLKPVDDGATTETGQTNNTTAVTMLAAPAANTKRVLKYLSLKNSDTAAAEPWIQINDNTTLREMIKPTLAVGDSIIYTPENGFYVVNSSGQIKSGATGTFTSTRVPFADSGGNLTTDAGFTFNTTGDILTAGAINVAGTTAPTVGLYNPSGTLLRTPNALTVDGTLTGSGGIVGGLNRSLINFTDLGTTPQSTGLDAGGVFFIRLTSVTGGYCEFIAAYGYTTAALLFGCVAISNCTASGATISNITGGDGKTYTLTRNSGDGLLYFEANSTATGTTAIKIVRAINI